MFQETAGDYLLNPKWKEENTLSGAVDKIVDFYKRVSQFANAQREGSVSSSHLGTSAYEEQVTQLNSIAQETANVIDYVDSHDEHNFDFDWVLENEPTWIEKLRREAARAASHAESASCLFAAHRYASGNLFASADAEYVAAIAALIEANGAREMIV